jgi:hypothetical protein
MNEKIQLQNKKKKKNSGRDPQGAWRQDNMIGDKPPGIK